MSYDGLGGVDEIAGPDSPSGEDATTGGLGERDLDWRRRGLTGFPIVRCGGAKLPLL